MTLDLKTNAVPVIAILLAAIVLLVLLTRNPSEESRLTLQAMNPGEPIDVHELGEEQSREAEAMRQVQALYSDLGVAVVPLEGGRVYASNEARPFPLASVAKLYILAAYLDTASTSGGGGLTEAEREQLAAMIEYSDNFSAQFFWDELGQIDGMQAYLRNHGLEPIRAGEEAESWGDIGQSSSGLAGFLAGLVSGSLLDPETTALALSLLGGVVQDQDWGVSAGINELDSSAQVMLKNGWYPATEGWRVNSAGLVSPGAGRGPYVLVILGEGFESFEDGVSTVESVALLINGIMLG